MHTRSSTGSVTRTQVVEAPQKLVLKLMEAKKPHIKWTEDTVDNENLGRKSSKRM